MNVSTIPPRLITRDQWVCWQYVEHDDSIGEQPVKRMGRSTQADDSITWGRHSEALKTHPHRDLSQQDDA